MTKNEYQEYVNRVNDFFNSEGIENLSGDHKLYFSWRVCDCCRRPEGGDHTHATGYNRNTKEILEYEICQDCLYFAEYGRLDDETMMNLE